MTRFAAFLAAMLMAAPAAAHDPLRLPVNYDPDAFWLDTPGIVSPGQARVRIIFNGQEKVAALGLDEFYAYQEAYRTELTRLAQHMSVHIAEPRARFAAFRKVVGDDLSNDADRLVVREIDPVSGFGLPSIVRETRGTLPASQ